MSPEEHAHIPQLVSQLTAAVSTGRPGHPLHICYIYRPHPAIPKRSANGRTAPLRAGLFQLPLPSRLWTPTCTRLIRHGKRALHSNQGLHHPLPGQGGLLISCTPTPQRMPAASTHLHCRPPTRRPDPYGHQPRPDARAFRVGTEPYIYKSIRVPVESASHSSGVAAEEGGAAVASRQSGARHAWRGTGQPVK
jgi:hypothetical protein